MSMRKSTNDLMETLKNVKAWMSQSHKNKTTLITSALTASTLSSRTNMVTFVYSRDSYNLQPGDALRIPAGTTYYLVNPHDNETLRVVTLVILVNKPGRFESFFLSSTQDQRSYL
ncbi:hypothetical protein JHK82_056446 [Glycine max]|nr:hypothetical protein JHK86_056279 [Glycine max]KAG4919004.1 hypothetical protein JHK85_057285 [Glycine max]KAG5075088.1 hypothetical protein JHK84_056319 [Glycine max]KAG5077751.1 hypothetical protein JHK82_056446 [Glycine max]